MNGRKVVDFLVLRSAFTRRNFTSVFLVLMFVSVYIMSGGKISTAVPRFPEGGAFGVPADPNRAAAAAAAAAAEAELKEKEAMKVLGVIPTEEQQAREQALNNRGTLFEEEAGEEKPLDKKGLLAGDTTNRRQEAKLRKLEKKPSDAFSAIEERLKIKRH